jgi:hypothetical protein
VSAVRVLYVGGLGRSGSTLLDRLLGQVPGFEAVGEIVYLWDHSLGRDHDCGCGKRFRDCPLWTAVGEEAFGGWSRVDAEGTLALQRRVDHTYRVPLLVAPWLRPAFARDLRDYASAMGRVLAAVRDVSGAQVVVDSSKYPAPAFVLRRAPEVDLRVVHIVRDPRGVAHSWGRTVRRPEQQGSVQEFMPRWAPGLSARRWVTSNLLMQALGLLGVPVLRLRYEDLVRDPAAALRRVIDFAGVPLDDASLAFLEPGAAQLGPNHTADGNPMRFTTGRVEIRADEAWRSRMEPAARRTVERRTWPLRLLYGYR